MACMACVNVACARVACVALVRADCDAACVRAWRGCVVVVVWKVGWNGVEKGRAGAGVCLFVCLCVCLCVW